MNALYKPTLEASSHVTEIVQAENGQKVHDFQSIYLGNTDIDTKLFVIFEHTFNHLSFGYVRSPHLEYYFSCFASFFLLFFLLQLFTQKPLNALHSKFERLNYQGEILRDRNWGCHVGVHPQSSTAKFRTFKVLELNESNLRNG